MSQPLTKEEIKHGNQWIARFMDYFLNPHDGGRTYIVNPVWFEHEKTWYGDDIKQLAFHVNWNEIMPVYVKLLDKITVLEDAHFSPRLALCTGDLDLFYREIECCCRYLECMKLKNSAQNTIKDA